MIYHALLYCSGLSKGRNKLRPYNYNNSYSLKFFTFALGHNPKFPKGKDNP